MTTQEKIAVMQAHLDGKVIQVSRRLGSDWELCKNPQWNWTDFVYRVTPKLITIYIYKYKRGEILSLLDPFESKDAILLKTIETEI